MNLGRESEKIEFKKGLASLDSGMKDMCAILNKKHSGVLYFGVENNGNVVGLEIGVKTENDISTRISQNFYPIPDYSIKTLNDENLKYIRIDFSGDKTPYSYRF